MTDSCLLDLIYVTLACEDVNSKLVDFVTVAEVDAEKCLDDSLVEILKFCQNFDNTDVWLGI